ncbi:MAG TPA: hypothetical protein VF043_32445 [Ktedonobacteraceae bacterium]
MSDHQVQDSSHLEGSRALQEKPQRHRGWSRSALLMVMLGCVILLGGGGILIWQVTAHTTPVPAQSTTASSGPIKAEPTQAAGCGPRLPWDFLVQQAASGLHLTVAQIKTQVLAGKTIQGIAAAQGISQNQLHTIEVQALRAAYDKFVSMGCYTQQEADAGFRQDSGETPTQLNSDFTRYFSNATT